MTILVMSTRIFTLIMNKMFIRVLETMRKVTTTSLIWICQPSRTNRVFHILGEVDWLMKKASIHNPSTLHNWKEESE